MNIRYLSKANKKYLSGTAIVRLDLNDDGYRMERAIPTLKYILKFANKLVILSHKGRPEPSLTLRDNKKYSLEPEAEKLSKLLDKKIDFIGHIRLSEAGNEIRNAKSGSIFMLENTRFLEGEKEDERELAEHFASLGNYFVNEAFASSHRKNASVTGITKFLPSYAGFDFEDEVENLFRIMKKTKRPFIAIFGGAKISDKLITMLSFRKKADCMLIGGALANTILYLRGEKVGKSLIEKEMDGAMLKIAGMKNLVMPKDFRKKGTAILDIGPKTEKEYAAIIKKAKTIVWNGPMGAFEMKGFENGTKRVIKEIANSRAFSVVGGSETLVLIRKMKLEKKFGFISTGGGAMLEFLGGKKLPGVEALKK
ncbi:MAG: phosphoglycerate kinase [Candidatus Paceibacterota bacterium]